MDGHGGPLYIGSGCYHRRESLLGKKYDKTHKLELVERERDYKSTASALEERAKNLVTCTFEDNTQWGNEVRVVLNLQFYVFLSFVQSQCGSKMKLQMSNSSTKIKKKTEKSRN